MQLREFFKTKTVTIYVLLQLLPLVAQVKLFFYKDILNLAGSHFSPPPYTRRETSWHLKIKRGVNTFKEIIFLSLMASLETGL